MSTEEAARKGGTVTAIDVAHYDLALTLTRMRREQRAVQDLAEQIAQEDRPYESTVRRLIAVATELYGAVVEVAALRRVVGIETDT